MHKTPLIMKYLTIILFAVVMIPWASLDFVRGATPQGEVVSFSLPVIDEETHIYAGPGENYYATGILPKGEIVEIFLRQENGWCAIKPPKGSFSWINGSYVRLDQGEIGIVTCEDNNREVPVRVGTDSVMKSGVIQVGLKNGRKVRVRGETKLPGGTFWYKIAPPAGEFRWVHESHLFKDESIRQIPSRLMLTREYLEIVMGEQKEVPAPTLEPAKLQTSDEPKVVTKNTEKGRLASNGIQLPELSVDVSQNNLTQSPTTNIATIAEKMRQQPTRPAMPHTDQSPFAAQSQYKVPVWDPESVEDGFSLEVARLNRDLFAVVARGAVPQVYDLLSDRAVMLFDIANTDAQRLDVQKIYQKIELFRNGVHSNVAINVPKTQPNKTTRGRQLIKPSEEKNSGDSIRFAFSGNRNPFKTKKAGNNESGITSSAPVQVAQRTPTPQELAAQARSRETMPRGIQLLAGGGSPTRVPPPDYTPVRSPESNTEVPQKQVPQNTPQSNVPQKTLQSPASHPPIISENKGFLAHNGIMNQPIRQMSASMPNTELPSTDQSTKPNIATWRSPGTSSNVIMRNQNVARPGQQSDSTPHDSAVNDSTRTTQSAQRQGFDAMGILGFLPESPAGYPPYALVENQGNQTIVLCYLKAESGQNLDRFIGKSIGVRGNRGMLNINGKSKPMITATTIFSIK